MAKPTREEYRKTNRELLLRKFDEECIRPARDRIQTSPNCFFDQHYQLIKDAKAYFRSRYGDLPGHQEALFLLAKSRLAERSMDVVVVDKSIGPWDSPYAVSTYAKLILLPETSWDEQVYYDPGTTRRQPGLAEFVQSLVSSSAAWRTSSKPTPPPPKDHVETDLETKVLMAEEELERNRSALKSYREAKEKAAQERVERERVARERAEQEARDRTARERAERERAEREAQKRAESDRKAREQTSHRSSGTPQWALVLELTPPYTEDQVRTAYRKKSKLTHPDLGGTDKEFREVDSAYDSAMTYCRTLKVSAL